MLFTKNESKMLSLQITKLIIAIYSVCLAAGPTRFRVDGPPSPISLFIVYHLASGPFLFSPSSGPAQSSSVQVLKASQLQQLDSLVELIMKVSW